MIIQSRMRLARTALLLCSLALTLMLAACGGAASTTPPSTGSTGPAPQATKAPATTAPATTTSGGTGSTTALQTYPGADFKIGYPGSWKVTPGDNNVSFVSPDGSKGAAVIAPDLGGDTSSDALAQAVQQYMQKNYQNVQDDGAPSSTAIAGENWTQKRFDGDDPQANNARATIIVISTLHQPTGGATKAYMMLFVAPKAEFDQDLDTYFNPMVSSFQFS